jgi:hypothetical protein
MPYPSTTCGQPTQKGPQGRFREGREGKGAKGKRKGKGGVWAYREGRPWTPLSITRAYHALPLYALQAATPETTSRSFSG